MQEKKYTYHEHWHRLMQTLPDDTRLEVYDAMNAYVFDGEERVLSAHAQGAFASIRIYLDAERRKSEAIREKRARAGRNHRGNQYKVAEQNGTNGTLVPKTLKDRELTENGEKMEQNGTNGTSVPNALKISEFGTSVPPPPTTPLYNNITTTTTKAGACAYTRMMEWLGDNEETLQILCMRNRLTDQPLDKAGMLAVLEPYVKTFIDAEAVREDIGRGYRREVKAWFERWLPKYIQATDEKTSKNNRGNKTARKGNSEQPDYFDI